MTRSLLCVVLIADVACWHANGAPPTTDSTVATRSRARETCTEGGERLVLRTCRDGNDLVWAITNHSDSTLWAFVAPQGTKQPTFSYANVHARAAAGQLMLSKVARGLIDGELVQIGALQLAPGETAHGVVPLGVEMDPTAAHINGAIPHGARIVSVTLEIGFAEQQRSDRTIPTRPEPLVIVTNFQRARQEIVRAPAVPWR